MKRINYLLMTAICMFSSAAWSQITVFSYTGAPEIYVVPPSVTSISIEVSGGQGGSGTGGAGGLGATMYGEFDVSPGDNLEIIVGGEGMQYGNSGGGGGGTGVVFAGTPLIVAGGGGGGSIYAAGYGGLISEEGGSSSGAGGVGGNGGQKGFRSSDCGWAAGGGGFYGDGYGGDGGWDGGFLPGTLGGAGAGMSYLSGGAGGVNGGCSFTFPNEGAYGCGGGGAGSYGGAGGGGYSGGGGGQYVDVGGAVNSPGGGGGSYNSGLEQVNIPSNNEGDGEVIITVLCNALTLTVSDYEICLGEELTLDAESATGGTISWDMDVIDAVPFTPGTSGEITYTATSDSDEDCELTVSILVHEAPIVNAGSGDENYCIGEEIVLSAGGNAETYEWDPTDLDPGLGSHTYTLTGESEYGCVGTDEVTVVVHDLPTVTASVDVDEICVGHPITVTGAGASVYDWDTPGVEDGEAFIPGEPGVYTYNVVGTDFYGCSNEASVSVTVAEEITITYTVTEEMVFEDGEIDITVSGGVAPYEYDWDIDGTGDFDDTEDLTGLADAAYMVVVNGSTGCSESALIVLGTQAGIGEDAERILSVYPNPAQDIVVITYDGGFEYELTTTDGKVVLKGNAFNQKEISMQEFAAGTYFINVIQDGIVKTEKLMKQ